MKEYIKNGNTGDIKDILKIRLHLWDVKRTTKTMMNMTCVNPALTNSVIT